MSTNDRMIPGQPISSRVAPPDARLGFGAGAGPWSRLSHALNTRWHRTALMAYAVIVIGHWSEHVAQAVQIYVLGWPRPQALGLLGRGYPWLVTSEWMHYGYALLMMVAFIVLRHGFTGRSRRWWNAAMWIQIWHHTEHLLLLVQAASGAYLLGAKVPTSVLQLVFPRVELHLFYNTIVTIPMVVAIVLHRRAAAGAAAARCTCAHPSRRAVLTPAGPSTAPA